jgi:hypothetical protein
MGLRDAFNVQLSVPALNGDAVATVLRSLDCFAGGEILQVRDGALFAAVNQSWSQALLGLDLNLCSSLCIMSWLSRLLLHGMCYLAPHRPTAAVVWPQDMPALLFYVFFVFSGC